MRKNNPTGSIHHGKDHIPKDTINKLLEKSRKELPFSLSPANLVNLLPHGQTRIYEMLQSGQIPGAKKIAGKWVINRDIFLAYIYTEDSENIP